MSAKETLHLLLSISFAFRLQHANGISNRAFLGTRHALPSKSLRPEMPGEIQRPNSPHGRKHRSLMIKRAKKGFYGQERLPRRNRNSRFFPAGSRELILIPTVQSYFRFRNIARAVCLLIGYFLLYQQFFNHIKGKFRSICRYHMLASTVN